MYSEYVSPLLFTFPPLLSTGFMSYIQIFWEYIRIISIHFSYLEKEKTLEKDMWKIIIGPLLTDKYLNDSNPHSLLLTQGERKKTI